MSVCGSGFLDVSFTYCSVPSNQKFIHPSLACRSAKPSRPVAFPSQRHPIPRSKISVPPTLIMAKSTEAPPSKPTTKELHKNLADALAEYDDLLELHDEHIQRYKAAHEEVHSSNAFIEYLEKRAHLVLEEEYEWLKEENEEAKEASGREMIKEREAVRKIRLQLKDIKEEVRGRCDVAGMI